MINFFSIYLRVLLLSFFIPILDFPLYLFEIDIVALGKLPFIFLFLISLVYHFKNKIYLNALSYLFLVVFLLSILLSIAYKNSFSSAYLSHIYAFIMPVLSISFGYNFYNSYKSSSELSFLFSKSIYLAFYGSIILTLFYIYFYYVTQQWSYYGFATALPLVFGYIFINSPRLAHFGFFLNILTGKRSSILVTLFFYLKKIKFVTILRKPIWSFVIIISLVFIFKILNDLEIFRRFALILEFDKDDSMAIFLATGGRLTEIISLYNYMILDPIKFVVGSGLGAKYLFVDPRQMYPDALMHYTHFSPTFYIFLIGVPSTLVMYFLIFKNLKFINKTEPITYIFLSFLINSFFGSIMFVDPRFWFFFGCLLGFKNFKLQKNG